MNILVTSFDPFGGESINPSSLAVRQLPDEINGAKIRTIEIPTAFGKSTDAIKAELEANHYDVVLSVGQAGGRKAITPERVAINIDDARIPDNEGQQPIDQVISHNGAPAYFTNLPVKRIVEAIQNANINSQLSNTAGTFVCNHVFYSLGELSESYPGLKFGFIHVPFLHEQINNDSIASMSLEDIVKGLSIAIEVITNHQNDVQIALGEIH